MEPDVRTLRAPGAFVSLAVLALLAPGSARSGTTAAAVGETGVAVTVAGTAVVGPVGASVEGPRKTPGEPSRRDFSRAAHSPLGKGWNEGGDLSWGGAGVGGGVSSVLCSEGKFTCPRLRWP